MQENHSKRHPPEGFAQSNSGIDKVPYDPEESARSLEKKLRIGIVVPLWERVPPPTYGGIELVVSLLAEELVRRGHDVTVFATGDSQTSAQLQSVYPNALRLDPNKQDYDIYELLQLSQVCEQAAEFDIIHFHPKSAAFPFAKQLQTPAVHTLHYPLTPAFIKLLAHYPDLNYISISDAQRQPELQLDNVATVYNGINLENYLFCAQPQDPPYLAFLGRLSPEKGPHHAIAIAKKVGMPLKLAGKVGFEDEEFFEQKIKHQIDGKQIEYLGELTHSEKVEFLGKAAVTLFPITWREPFGLVMIESMCTGTPVIGMKLGSVPEVIAHGQTGFVCNSPEEMAELIPAALKLERQACRNYVANRFSVNQMVDGYEAAYWKAISAYQSMKNRV